jgi:acid stress chaperone HdeB
MAKRLTLSLTIAFILAATVPTQAQVSIDVAKMTCGQFATFKVANPKFIAIWLNGYHHGTRGDTVIDTQQLDSDTQKIQDYCTKNENVPLMQAVETVIAPHN